MSAKSQFLVLGVLLAIALIWFSMWLGGPSGCATVSDVRVGSMLVAGCTRP